MWATIAKFELNICYVPGIDLNAENKKHSPQFKCIKRGFVCVFGDKHDGLGEIFHKLSLAKTKEDSKSPRKAHIIKTMCLKDNFKYLQWKKKYKYYGRNMKETKKWWNTGAREGWRILTENICVWKWTISFLQVLMGRWIICSSTICSEAKVILSYISINLNYGPPIATLHRLLGHRCSGL